MNAGLFAMAACGAVGSGSHAAEAQAAPVTDIAMFRDATEILFAVADLRRATDPSASWVPTRAFVKDADQAHLFAFEGPTPIVGMSLDDLLDCARSSHPKAGELVAFAGVHRGFLHLMAAPGISGIGDLKGKQIAVDTDTGYASALFEILHRNGLERNRDYEVVYAGATNLRYEKLLAGAFDATLLGAPYTRLAARKGYPSLGTVIGALGGYQAIVLVTQRPWLAANGETAVQIAACMRETLAWARAPGNAAALYGFIAQLFPTLDAEAARDVADDMFGLGTNFLADGRMNAEDIGVVIDLFNATRGAALTPESVAAVTDFSRLPPR